MNIVTLYTAGVLECKSDVVFIIRGKVRAIVGV